MLLYYYVWTGVCPKWTEETLSPLFPLEFKYQLTLVRPCATFIDFANISV